MVQNDGLKKDTCFSGRMHELRLGTATLLVSLLCVFILLPCTAGAQDIRPGDTLGLDECVDIALKRHPGLLGAAGNLKASRSRIGVAKSGYYPQVNASAAYSRDHSADLPDKEGSTYNQYESTVNLNQTILDFGKTSAQVDVQSLGAQASQEDYQDVSRQIVFNVKQAYYGILQSKQSREAFAEEVRQLQLHLDQAKRFYAVGLKSRIDVTNAEVNLGQARLGLLGADNALRLTRIALNNAMGMPDAPAFEIRDAAGRQDYRIDLEGALKKGYDERPDLRAARAKEESVQRSVDLARKGYYPVLSGNAGYGFSGRDYPLDEEWTVGATLSFPLFSGFLTRYQIQEAKANAETARANVELIRQNVRYEIEQAYYNLQNVRERITLAELTMKQAQENRELAQGRYANGVGSSIEVADAVQAEVYARTSYITAMYDYRIAVASLEKAMGGDR